MSSPRLTDEQLETDFGRRPEGQAFDQPQELGYICPKGHKGDWLAWSEFVDHIWCYKCQKDYHYANDCRIKRICWMSNTQFNDFINGLPLKPEVIRGIQHFPDCIIPHKQEEKDDDR